MGEIKGQLLSVLLVMVIFGAIAGALYAAFNNTKDKIVSKIENVDTNIKPSQLQQIELLSFKY